MKTYLYSIAVLTVACCSAMAAAPVPLTSLNETLIAASKDDKMTFIMVDQPTGDANGEAVRTMIRNGKIHVTDKEYVMANLNVTDQAIVNEFLLKFAGQDFGHIIPLVAITDSKGRLLAGFGGLKNASDYNQMLSLAKAKAEKLASYNSPEPSMSLDDTLAAAAKGNKMAFILLGRSQCGICNATRSMIHNGKILLSDTEYVMADLNCDDQVVKKEFDQKFATENFGDTLPFVVVTDQRGNVLASSGGSKNVEQWNYLLDSAKAKAKVHPSTSSSGPELNTAPTSGGPAVYNPQQFLSH